MIILPTVALYRFIGKSIQGLWRIGAWQDASYIGENLAYAKAISKSLTAEYWLING